MGAKRTHEDFIRELYVKNKFYREQKFELLSKYNLAKDKLLLKTAYGCCTSLPSLLLSGGGIDIRSAIDKTEYFLNSLEGFYGDIVFKGEYLTHDSIFEFNSSGECFKVIASDLQRRMPVENIIKSGLNKKQYLIQEIENNNPKFISGEYSFYTLPQRTNETILIKTRYGVVKAKVVALIKGETCYGVKEAVDKQKYALSIIKEKSPLYKQTNYENFTYSSRKNCKFTCKIHNITYTQRIDHHIDGKNGCFKCSNEKSFINKEKIDLNPKLYEEIKAIFYIVKINEFYKVGFTRRSVTERISHITDVYEVVYEENTNILDAVYREQQILEAFENYSYVPEFKFRGWTECLSINPYEFIMNSENEHWENTMKLNCIEMGINYEQNYYI